MSFNELVDNLVAYGTLTIFHDPDEGTRYSCECGSDSVAKASLRNHFISARHKRWKDRQDLPQSDCAICYERKSDFYTCSQCRNQHCMQCHGNIIGNKCPFCRTHFDGTVPSLEVENGYDLDGFVVPDSEEDDPVGFFSESDLDESEDELISALSNVNLNVNRERQLITEIGRLLDNANSVFGVRAKKLCVYEVYLVLQENLDILHSNSNQFSRFRQVIREKFMELEDQGFDIAQVCLENLQL